MTEAQWKIFFEEFDKMKCTVYRFEKQEPRDTVFDSIKMFNKDGTPSPEEVKEFHVAKGVDAEGFFFVILRDKDTKENNIFSYAANGGIIKDNTLDISAYKAAYRTQYN